MDPVNSANKSRSPERSDEQVTESDPDWDRERAASARERDPSHDQTPLPSQTDDTGPDAGTDAGTETDSGTGSGGALVPYVAPATDAGGPGSGSDDSGYNGDEESEDAHDGSEDEHRGGSSADEDESALELEDGCASDPDEDVYDDGHVDSERDDCDSHSEGSDGSEEEDGCESEEHDGQAADEYESEVDSGSEDDDKSEEHDGPVDEDEGYYGSEDDADWDGTEGISPPQSTSEPQHSDRPTAALARKRTREDDEPAPTDKRPRT